MLEKLKSFGRGVVAIAKAHPVLFGLSVLALPLVIGGVTWKVIALIRRVPGGSTVANAAGKVAGATGSA